MPITGDPNAVAIVTFKAAPLSMGDCFIKVTPEANKTTYEVTGQFLGLDDAAPTSVSGAVRAEAEDFLQDIVDTVGGIAQTQEVKGPKGMRVIVPADYVPGDLVNPFSAQTYTGLILTGVSSQDTGSKHYAVTFTFIKPLTNADDGTTASTVKFDGTEIGNRGGDVSVSADGSTVKISATSYYAGATPLTYIVNLCNTLGLNPNNIIAQPRGAATNRAAIRSYNATVSTFEWVGKGTIASAVLQSLDANEDTPGILTIRTSFVAPR